MNEAQENLLDHYKNPRNFGKPQWIPTHTAKLENLSCGDTVIVHLLVENNIITNYAFEAEGCSIAIASASILGEIIIGKSLDDTLLYSLPQHLENIGINLTTARLKCANLSLEAVKDAINK